MDYNKHKVSSIIQRPFLRSVAALLVLPLCAAGVVLFLTLTSRQPSYNTTAPSPVITQQAAVIDQGVEITWHAAQPGAHSIVGYAIERSRQGSEFKHIGRTLGNRVETFLDADGKAGDVYRVITEDDQNPAHRSAPSDEIAASSAKPGETIIAQSDHPAQVLGLSTIDRRAPPDEQATGLQTLATQALKDLKNDLDKRQPTRVDSKLTALQEYYHRILKLFPQLSPAQKHMLAQECDRHMLQLETDLHALPETKHLDVMTAIAGCNAIKESAR